MNTKRTMSILIVFAVLLMCITVQAQEDANWLPAPTGQYQVGTTFYHWMDDARDELMTDDPDDKRELVVRFWYPADVEADAVPISYFPNGEIEVDGFVAAQGPFIATVETEVVAATTAHSYLNAPVSDAESVYPVLVFSPGVPRTASMSTAHIQELASRGYIVAAINYPYISGWTVFPDGEMVVSRMDPSLEEMALEIMTQDQVFVLDQLEALNASSEGDMLAGRLDLNHIGALGPSLGGWVAALGSLADARFKVVLLEGPHGILPMPVIEAGLDVPTMFLDPEGEDSLEGFAAMNGPAYRVSLNGISGLNMADFLLWPGMADGVPPELLGEVPTSRSIQVINAYALAFLDQYLKGDEKELLQGASDDYPEVVIQSRNIED